MNRLSVSYAFIISFDNAEAESFPIELLKVTTTALP